MHSPTSFTSSAGDKGPRKSRQRVGSACEECRRRKLRCDGNQPQCEACFETGVECVTAEARLPRGPKRGHMKALQARIATLEQRLLKEQQLQQAEIALDEPANYVIDDHNMDAFFDFVQADDPKSSVLTPKSTPKSENTSIPKALEAPTSLFISDLLRADLDQLYFERSHPFVPILHKGKYFSQVVTQETKRDSQKCLQYAMWTLAASLSAQLQHIRESLYECTIQALASLESNDSNAEFADLDHIQARVLLLIYEFMRTNHQRAWISAGRCIRLVQLMRLYEVDSLENVTRQQNAADPEDWIRTEEKRRTFWMVYSLDRFISIRHEWPLTINEQVISTRLPCPEDEFQSGQYVQMGFLSEAVTSFDPTGVSPFTESIILATICGRALAHRQQSTVEEIYSNIPQHFWDRHDWLDTMVKIRTENMLLQYPSRTRHTDCMVLFIKMVAQATVLYLCQIIESTAWKTDEYRSPIAEFKQRSLAAAQEIVNLSRSLSHLSYFKVHPFTPLPLVLCVDFFNAHRYLDESVDVQVQEISRVLQDMSGVNNLAHDYMS